MLGRRLSILAGVVLLAVGTPACSRNDEGDQAVQRVDSVVALRRVVNRLGDDLRLMGQPRDNVAAAARHPWATPELSVVVRTPGGRMVVSQFANQNYRAAAEQRARDLTEGDLPDSFAGCKLLLVTFWGYADQEQAVRSAAIAKRVLRSLEQGECGLTPENLTSPPSTTAPATPQGSYTIAVQAQLNGQEMVIEGTTNLPDSSLLTILVSEALRFEGEAAVRSSAVGSDGVTVSGGQYRSALTLGTGPTPVAAIGDTLLVCVQFRTGEEDGDPIQPSSVSEQVGPDGEHLEGSPQLHVFGELSSDPANWLEASQQVAYGSPPIEDIRDDQGFAPAIEPLAPFCLA